VSSPPLSLSFAAKLNLCEYGIDWGTGTPPINLVEPATTNYTYPPAVSRKFSQTESELIAKIPSSRSTFPSISCFPPFPTISPPHSSSDPTQESHLPPPLRIYITHRYGLDLKNPFIRKYLLRRKEKHAKNQFALNLFRSWCIMAI